MKKLIPVLLFSLFLVSTKTFAGPGDTITVQTFTYGSPQEGWFVFPSDSFQFEKVFMKYKLKCNPNQNPACGEWDYLTYTYLYQPTIDSVILNAPNYIVNGSSPDSFQYNTDPAYQLDPYWQYFIANIDTISLNAYTIGAGNTSSTNPLGASEPVSRTQYLWRASELSAAGLIEGNITSLQFNLPSSGGFFQYLSIRMKTTLLDSLTNSDYENSGFTEVYQWNTTMMNSGWNNLPLTYPFNWDGTSNVVIEITYDNEEPASDVEVLSDPTSFPSGVNTVTDGSSHFNDANYISVPAAAFADVDSFITVSFWFKGDPFLQDRTTFEANNIYNSRILNVHLPWSDGNIYWDAGTSLIGGFDRIYKSATLNEYQSEWHHWAFTKNCATGSMKIYKDGMLWHSGTGATRLMNDIQTFWIGSALWNYSVSANGVIDEFAVWNVEVDEVAIQQYLYKDLDANHPYENDLLVYYQFNDNDPFTVADMSGNGFDGSIVGAQLQNIFSEELFRNVQSTASRPQLIFEQGVFDSYVDSSLVIDTAWTDPLTLILYNDVNNPDIATDSQLIWVPYFQYVFDGQGNIIDSVWVNPSNTIYHSSTSYSSGLIPILRRFEIGRYITPYGINLDLGEGFTWTYDVSDYITLLRDSVFLTAGNWQELLDMQFIMIEGTPPRQPIKVENLWTGGVNYGITNDPVENHLTPKNILIDPAAFNTRLKARITGHGFGGTSNCAEFCARNHYFKVDGVTQFTNLVWRDNCDLNPVYPQGGTWVYDRANWCPGAEVWTYDMELTPFVTPGSSSTLDYDIQAYTWNGQGSTPYYSIETQMISYGAPNFALDASVDEIITPNNYELYKRMNPICNNPLIRIKNTGTTTLTSLTIAYGIENGTPQTFQWTGNLDFLETEEVNLGQIFAPASGNSNKFVVTLSSPNGGSDQYAYNNSATTYYNFPPQFPSPIVVDCRTNHNGNETSYTLMDDQGNIILERDNLLDDTYYKDTLNLANGCYIFRLNDSGEDGLSFWANSQQGFGYIRFMNPANGSLVKSYIGDFGGEVFQEFTIGYYLNTPELLNTDEVQLNVYPNPSPGIFAVELLLPQSADAVIEVFDLSGRKVYEKEIQEAFYEALDIDLSNFTSGMYLLKMETGGMSYSQKMILHK